MNIHTSINIILPLFLYGCGTWSLTLREEHTFGVSANRVLRRIFGSEKEDVAGSWRGLHNEELHNLYTSPKIIQAIKPMRMGWVETCNTHGRD
jgi:hypothetical protein